MAYDFLSITKAAIARHGSAVTYTRVSAGVYDLASGGSTATTTTHSIKAYKKHIKSTQFNFPNLIGREAAIFYVAADALAFVPKIKDQITIGTSTYTVDSIMEHVASGAIVLYKLVAVIS